MGYSDILYRGRCNVWFRGDCVQIIFPSIGCQKVPRCTMCNFGCYNRNCTDNEAVEILDSGLSFFAKTHSDYAFNVIHDRKSHERIPDIVLLLGTYGSILDKKEFKYLERIFEYINTQTQVAAIRTVILETHYTTINCEYLYHLKNLLKPNVNGDTPQLFIEVGLESIDPKVQTTLKKNIDLNEFKETMAMLKFMGIGTIVNVLFGAPGLTTEEQIADCIKTITWAYCLDIDEICLFPINIWEGSSLWVDYTHGLYQRPSFYSFWRVLKGISPYALGKLSFSWYGDRQQRNPGWNTEQAVLPPDTGNHDLAFWINAIEWLQSFKDIGRRVQWVDSVAYCIESNNWDNLQIKYFKYHYVPDLDKYYTPTSVTVPILDINHVNMNNTIFTDDTIHSILHEEESEHE